ncbi:MAG: FtsX-like permease family protein [Thermoplasmata archaeon]|nr:MAG: FtsX-like permease family protein [Thermoplasmata archaeon]
MSIELVMIILLLLVLVGIGFSAARNRIVFDLGVRNIGRRKGNTIIMVIGLMIGTAIITASLTIGDTMDNMVDSVVTDGLGEVDLIIVDITAEGEGGALPLDEYGDLRTQILDIPHVEAVMGEYSDGLPVISTLSRQSEPTMPIMGLDPSELDGFGGIKVNGRKVDFDLAANEVYLNEGAADVLDVRAGGYIQIYNSSGPQNFMVKDVVDSDGYANWNLRNNILVNIEVAWALFEVDEVVNMIKISNEGDKITGARYSDEVQEAVEPLIEDYPNLEAMANKREVIENNRRNISQLTDLFLVFGTFTIIAGVILIINIFVMLAEERKAEMGISRAIGMKRKHLKREFLYEGSAYALLAGVVGILFGIVIAYASMWAIRDMATGGDQSIDILRYFSFSISSLLVSYIVGFYLTVGTILFVTGRISKLNIVRAIRKIPEPLVPRKDTRIMITGIIVIVLSVLLLMGGIQGEQAGLAMTGLSLIFYGAAILVRRFIGDRASFSIFSLIVLFLWMGPIELFEDYSAGMEMFILSGMVLVGSSVILVMFNSETILNAVSSLGSTKRAGQAVFKIAVSYPLKNKLRTGMTIMIFGLIIFTIVVLSMIVNIFNVNIEKITEEQSGGFDIFAYTNENLPLTDIKSEIEQSENLSMSDFDEIYPLQYSYAKVGSVNGEEYDGNGVLYYNIIGCPQDFIGNNSYTFVRYSDRYDSEREVWEALLTNSSYVIIDGSVEPQEYGPSLGLITADVGDTITLTNRTDGDHSFEVIGILQETFIQGLFMSDVTIAEKFNVTTPTLFMFELSDDSKVSEIARELESEFFEYGLQPIVIAEIIEEVTQATNMFFNLFSAFLGAGLIIGVSALGIITLRSVHERRLEIGMMRAIGFKRKMVRRAFLFEATLIAVWGLIIGTLQGLYVGWYIWESGFREMDYVFTIPWMRIGVVLLIAIVFILICVLPPSHQASKVEPAEALRFE